MSGAASVQMLWGRQAGVGERVQLHKKLKFNHKVSETKVWKKLILFVITNQTERHKILEDT